MVAGGAGIIGAVLLAHGDEPVALAVVTKGNGVGVDFLYLGAGSFHLFPGGGDGKAVGVKEGLVVVKYLGGLGERHGVHEAVAKLGTFGIVTGDEVRLLLVGQAEYFGGAVRAGNLDLAVDKAVKRGNSAGQIVKRNMVGIAIGYVGLVANGDLGAYLVAHVVIAADFFAGDVDIGIELVELLDVKVQHIAQVGAHGVIEGQVDFASVVTGFGDGEVAFAHRLGRLLIVAGRGTGVVGSGGFGGLLIAGVGGGAVGAGSQHQRAEYHKYRQHGCQDTFCHFLFSLPFFMLSINLFSLLCRFGLRPS